MKDETFFVKAWGEFVQCGEEPKFKVSESKICRGLGVYAQLKVPRSYAESVWQNRKIYAYCVVLRE